MEGGKKRKHNCQCGYQGLGQETPCQKLQQYGEGNINHYCLKHYNQSLQHQQGRVQPQSTNPVDGHIIVSASSSIRQDELHLNQATAQPHSKNPINAMTDNDGIIVNAFTSILNENLVVAQATTRPCSATPIDTTATNNSSSSFWQDELLLDQATAHPISTNPVNTMTDNNGIIVDASTSIPNE